MSDINGTVETISSVGPDSLTWVCPEGHMFRYRQRPLRTSCVFIFCFFILERGAVYMLKTFLYSLVERTMQLKPSTPTYGYVLVSVFFGVHDTAPIFLSMLSDCYLGAYKSIVIFGFMLVFGLSVLAWIGGSWVVAPNGTMYPALLALLGLVAVSAGSLVPCLTAFGASQLHPISHSKQSSRYFSWIFASSNLGAILGIVIAVIIHAQLQYGFVLVTSAIASGIGWLLFIFGSHLYVTRCIHTPTVMKSLRLLWSCLLKRSFSKNKRCNNGEFEDSLVDDIVLLCRLIPIFFALIPLYAGQLQIFTTFRSLAYQMVNTNSKSDDWLKNGGSLSSRQPLVPPEILLAVEPTAAVLCAVVLEYWLWPYLQSKKLLPTHLTRLIIAGCAITLGFVAALILQYADDEGAVLFACFVPSLFTFAVGQYLITTTGYELSWTHAPESMKTLSVSIFLTIYALGSVLATLTFSAMGAFFDEPAGSASNLPLEGFRSRFDVYFLINTCLCVSSVVFLMLMRNFYTSTKQMRIEREIERKALEIALQHLRENNHIEGRDGGTNHTHISALVSNRDNDSLKFEVISQRSMNGASTPLNTKRPVCPLTC